MRTSVTCTAVALSICIAFVSSKTFRPDTADDVRSTAETESDFRRTTKSPSSSTGTGSENRFSDPVTPRQSEREGDADNERNESRNDTWHAHIHIDDVFNKTTKLEEVAYGESTYFISKIFRKYGAQNSLASFDFDKLMRNLGLITSDKETESMASHNGQDADDLEKSALKVKKRSVGSVTHVHTDHSQCYRASELMSAFHFESLTRLQPDHFLLLCPALIDQLDNSGCHLHHDNQHRHDDEHRHDHHQEGGHATSKHHGTTSDDDHSAENTDVIVETPSAAATGIGDIPPLVWVYSFVAVLVISLVGLLGVATIPIMRKLFYTSLLQFLIALAVGALSGDALLHLLPHALGGGHSKHPSPETQHYQSGHVAAANDSDHRHTSTDEKHDDHDTELVWKGLVALSGLLLFFLVERLLGIVTSRREKRKVKKRAKRKAQETDIKRHKAHAEVLILPEENLDYDGNTPVRETAILGDDDDDDDDGDETFLNSNHDHHDHASHPQDHHDHAQGHGHSHHHGELPGSVSAVAWMVIMGDGIHNFSDGLAIGAAFASSITGGFSTAVAVFCHELPHEIGDFAMLLKSGMSAKQAIMYNVVSSVLCLLGMVGGVLLGQVDNASSWIFCAVAGMFLYISLADMLPQLTVSEEKGAASPCSQLLAQCLGVGVGAGIMLTIAVFENDLRTMME